MTNEKREKEISLRLAEDISVVESINGLLKSKQWERFVSSFITPNIGRLYRQIENAARNSQGEQYMATFYGCQGQIKILEKLEDLETFKERYDDEIKGLKNQINAKT